MPEHKEKSKLTIGGNDVEVSKRKVPDSDDNEEENEIEETEKEED